MTITEIHDKGQNYSQYFRECLDGSRRECQPDCLDDRMFWLQLIPVSRPDMDQQLLRPVRRRFPVKTEKPA